MFWIYASIVYLCAGGIAARLSIDNLEPIEIKSPKVSEAIAVAMIFPGLVLGSILLGWMKRKKPHKEDSTDIP